jgi:hypothetical protein
MHDTRIQITKRLSSLIAALRRRLTYRPERRFMRG